MKTKHEISILILLFFAAWVCQFFVYIPMSEDYLLAIWYQDGLLAKIQELYEKTGIRRSVGMVTNAPLCAGPLWLTNYVLIAMHFTVTLLIYAVCRMISRSGVVGLVVALVVGLFPWGYGAVTYACGSYTMPSSILFLLGLLILLKHSTGTMRSEWTAIIFSSVILLLCCISGEHYVFAVALTGLFALSATDKGITFHGLLRPWVLAPGFVSAFYILLVYATQSGDELMDSHWRETSLLETFNPLTLGSVWFYQYRNLLFFETLFNWKAISLSLMDMGFLRVAIGIAFAMSALVLLIIYRKKSFLPPTKDNKAWWNSPLSVILLIMLAISFVHALAGGYSASSRHQYAPVVILALFGASLLSKVRNIDKILLTGRGALIWIFACIAILNTWVVVGINRIELKRYDDLCNYIAAQKIQSPVDIELVPPLNYLWPNMSKTTSTVFDSEYSINLNLQFKKENLIEIDPQSKYKITVENAGEENIITMSEK
jgi:hypothetical protein